MSPAPLPPRLAQRLRSADLTYPEVGRTAGPLPEGYHHARRERVLGSGPDCFESAAEVLLGWRMHERAGLRVAASSPVVEDGAVVLLRLGIGPVAVSIPCRVVYVVAEPDRRGFAYGTLPGHPESGEESFVLDRSGDGVVRFTVTAFSRPATALTRAAGPLGRRFQDFMTGRYLRAVSG